jgi:hypothetical protein
MAASGAAAMTGVPPAGLPKITSVVSRSDWPTARASALWSITANTFAPAAPIASVSLLTVSATPNGLCLLTIPSTGSVLMCTLPAKRDKSAIWYALWRNQRLSRRS